MEIPLSQVKNHFESIFGNGIKFVFNANWHAKVLRWKDAYWMIFLPMKIFHQICFSNCKIKSYQYYEKYMKL